MLRLLSALMGLALVVASFAYGIGVGRYDWPPAALLRAARDQIFGHHDRASQNTYIEARRSIFQNTPGEADVVMLGDSLTEQGNWSDLLINVRVMNRGVAGDTSGGVFERLPEVILRRPHQVFLMIGINDLLRGSTPEPVVENITRIIHSLREAQIYPALQSVLLVGEKHDDLNPQIQRLNAMLRDIAQSTGVALVDLNPVLAPSGRLASEFTYDGIHLTGAAYLRWREAIEDFLTIKSRG